MLTALAFAHQGFKVTIIESKCTKDVKFLDDNRTTALTDASKEFLGKIAIWVYLEKIVGVISDIYVLDNKSPRDIHFSSAQVEHNPMGYIIENSKLKKLLLSKVVSNNLITLIDNCVYKNFESFSDYCSVNLSDDELTNIRCDLLVLCEGYNSKIRQTYFTELIKKSYDQIALTFNVSHQRSHESTAIEHFTDTGPFAILPLQNVYESSVVWTLDIEKANILYKLPIVEFQYVVQQNFGNFLGNISITTEISAHRLKAYLTQNYFYQRIVLVADSAHIIHPLAGQGLNMGIKDINTLVDLTKIIGINQGMLQKYQQRRKLDNKLMYLITDNLNNIFHNQSNLIKKLRKFGFILIENLITVKTSLIKYAMGRR
ncbi:MAG: 2-octaprenyl-6-methoxyphenyl hydroxylase [Rickettsiaceae bacterium]|nr:MAG: 2-octaprenyl-6-methoxyphenyl hydroxylase [Rickettsiaceae bacterium]